MKTFLLTLLIATTVQAAPKRFNITNLETGMKFAPESESGQLPQSEPAWGKPARRTLKERVTPWELSRCTEVTVSEKAPGLNPGDKERDVQVTYCDLPADYSIVEEDLTQERADKETKETTRKNKIKAIKALKDKAVLTNLERDQILNLLLNEYLSDKN